MRTATEQQELLRTSRKSPRPAYFSKSMEKVQISYEFEAYLIQADTSTKQELLTRLRKSLDQIEFGLDAEAMAKMAAEYETAAVGAQKDELALELGDYSSFSAKTLRAQRLPETSQMINDIGAALGPKLFQRDQAENDIVHAGAVAAEISSGTGRANKRKQIQSWITIISAYLTKV